MIKKKLVRNSKKVLVVGDSYAYRDEKHSHWVDLIFTPLGITVDYLSVPGGSTAAVICNFWNKIGDTLSDYQCLFYFPTSLLRHVHFTGDDASHAPNIVDRLYDYINAPEAMMDFYLYGDFSYTFTEHGHLNREIWETNKRRYPTSSFVNVELLDAEEGVERSIYSKTPIWYNTQLSMLATRSLFLKAKQYDILTINNIQYAWRNDSQDIQKYITEIDINWIIEGYCLMDDPDNLEAKNHVSLAAASKIKQEFIKNINSQGYKLS